MNWACKQTVGFVNSYLWALLISSQWSHHIAKQAWGKQGRKVPLDRKTEMQKIKSSKSELKIMGQLKKMPNSGKEEEIGIERRKS